MAWMAAATLVMGALQANQQQKAGQLQAASLAKQGEYNAQVYEQQAGLILEKKKVEEYQYNRAGAKLRGAIASKTAGRGLMMGGSPLAIAIDSESQLQYDKAITDYNSTIERNFAVSGANYSRWNAREQGALATSTGNSNAFSTLLNTGSNYGMSRIGKL